MNEETVALQHVKLMKDRISKRTGNPEIVSKEVEALISEIGSIVAAINQMVITRDENITELVEMRVAEITKLLEEVLEDPEEKEGSTSQVELELDPKTAEALSLLSSLIFPSK